MNTYQKEEAFHHAVQTANSRSRTNTNNGGMIFDTRSIGESSFGVEHEFEDILRCSYEHQEHTSSSAAADSKQLHHNNNIKNPTGAGAGICGAENDNVTDDELLHYHPPNSNTNNINPNNDYYSSIARRQRQLKLHHTAGDDTFSDGGARASSSSSGGVEITAKEAFAHHPLRLSTATTACITEHDVSSSDRDRDLNIRQMTIVENQHQHQHQEQGGMQLQITKENEEGILALASEEVHMHYSYLPKEKKKKGVPQNNPQDATADVTVTDIRTSTSCSCSSSREQEQSATNNNTNTGRVATTTTNTTTNKTTRPKHKQRSLRLSELEQTHQQEEQQQHQHDLSDSTRKTKAEVDKLQASLMELASLDMGDIGKEASISSPSSPSSNHQKEGKQKTPSSAPCSRMEGTHNSTSFTTESTTTAEDEEEEEDSLSLGESDTAEKDKIMANNSKQQQLQQESKRANNPMNLDAQTSSSSFSSGWEENHDLIQTHLYLPATTKVVGDNNTTTTNLLLDASHRTGVSQAETAVISNMTNDYYEDENEDGESDWGSSSGNDDDNDDGEDESGLLHQSLGSIGSNTLLYTNNSLQYSHHHTNGWDAPLGVHKIITSSPGLMVSTQVHRKSVPVITHEGLLLVIPQGSFVEVLDTRVHGDRVRGRICWEEELDEDDIGDGDDEEDGRYGGEKNCEDNNKDDRDSDGVVSVRKKKEEEKKKKKKSSRSSKLLSLKKKKKKKNNKPSSKNGDTRNGKQCNTEDSISPENTTETKNGKDRNNKYEGWISLQWATSNNGNGNNHNNCSVASFNNSSSIANSSFDDDDGDRSIGIVESRRRSSDFSTGPKVFSTDEGSGPWTKSVPLGVYQIAPKCGLLLHETPGRESSTISKLGKGRYVEVVQTRVRSGDGAVMARVIVSSTVSFQEEDKGTTASGTNRTSRTKSGWITLQNPQTSFVGATPTPLGAYVIVADDDAGCVVTEGASVNSKVKGALKPGHFTEVVATRMEDQGVVRGLIASGGYITLFDAPKYGKGRKITKSSTVAMSVPVGIYQTVEDALNVTDSIAPSSLLLKRLPLNSTIDVLETHVENGGASGGSSSDRVRARIQVVNIEKQNGMDDYTVSKSDEGWITLFETRRDKMRMYAHPKQQQQQ